MSLLTKGLKVLAEGAEKKAARAGPLAVKLPVKPKPKAPVKPKPKAPAKPTTGVKPKLHPYMETRKGERAKAENLRIRTTDRPAAKADDLSVFDLDGQPFVLTMSDISGANKDITGVRGADFAEPVHLMGGQDYMFARPGSLWAADRGAAGNLLNTARAAKRETGVDPLLLPWTMGQKSHGFSHMPRELMLRTAAENLGRRDASRLSKDIRGILPEFSALDDPASVSLFRSAGGQSRGALNRLLDQYREDTGLGIGQALAATADPEQVGAPLTVLRNVGRFSPERGLEPSTHPSYNTDIPGEGLGRLREQVAALELLPDLMAAAGMDDAFKIVIKPMPGSKSPMRAMQMKPQRGVITEDILRAIEARLAASN